MYEARECIQCPEEYKTHQEQETLCKLHSELELLNQEQGNPSQISNKTKVTCQYENNTSSELLCSLWCQIQLYDSQECILCPEEYTSHPENITLCNLYTELELLKQDKGEPMTDPTNNTLISCQYMDDPSAELLCSLWCDVEEYDSKSCIKCPSELKEHSENVTLCDLHEELELLKQSRGEVDESSDNNLIVCDYKNHSSSEILCNLWCDIQLYNNNQCIKCPTDYSNHIENNTLCNLHTELQLLQQSKGNVTEMQNMEPIPCLFRNNTHHELLCDLWCDIQLFDEKRCIMCPDNFKNDPESKELCQIYQELEIAKFPSNIQLTTAPSNPEPIRCSYEDNPTSSQLLCEVWCQLQKLSGEF